MLTPWGKRVGGRRKEMNSKNCIIFMCRCPCPPYFCLIYCPLSGSQCTLKHPRRRWPDLGAGIVWTLQSSRIDRHTQNLQHARLRPFHTFDAKHAYQSWVPQSASVAQRKGWESEVSDVGTQFPSPPSCVTSGMPSPPLCRSVSSSAKRTGCVRSHLSSLTAL